MHHRNLCYKYSVLITFTGMNLTKQLLLLFISPSLFFSCSNNGKTEIEQDKALEIVSNKMAEQEHCWNEGDLECFMQHYWHSDSLMFIGKSGLTYGWQQTLDNYVNGYPDKSAMGKLTFTNEVKEFIDIETIQVIGQWELKRDSLENLGGYYSLIWKLKDGEWAIVSDHSS